MCTKESKEAFVISSERFRVNDLYFFVIFLSASLKIESRSTVCLLSTGKLFYIISFCGKPEVFVECLFAKAFDPFYDSQCEFLGAIFKLDRMVSELSTLR